MKFKIINSNPPNYWELSKYFELDNPKYQPLFPWGSTLYNPSGNEIPVDVEVHEEVHSNRQAGKPEMWWKRYMLDDDFRLEEELVAYATQFIFIKKTLGAKVAKEALADLSDNLASPMYNLGIEVHKAHSLIRRKVQELEKM